MIVRVVQEAFDSQAETAAFVSGRDDAGALASFVGYCRAATDGAEVSELRIDHYPGFTEHEIARLAQDIHQRFDCLDLLVIHRVGKIRPGEAIVLVAALATHRDDAFEAVRVLMDYLKTDAPLWKKESGPAGTRWIEPRAEDHVRRREAGKEVA
ncbi:MAG TPA: molybdenum cofactor biosynthesis protein MoaE [Rhizomicrobium sp.]|jgi:molybdopterin synthase catalytic subunit|nr:molybdenum cofactor biosynthesis protein MoaE [Rhizomicrobium sp.]